MTPKTPTVPPKAQTLRDLAAYVQNGSGGDEAKILSAGMSVRDAAAPVTMMPVTGLESSPGEDSGEVDLTWNPVRGASTGEVTTNAMNAAIGAAIDTTSANTNGVDTLDTPFADPDMDTLRQKLNELILNGRR